MFKDVDVLEVIFDPASVALAIDAPES